MNKETADKIEHELFELMQKNEFKKAIAFVHGYLDSGEEIEINLQYNFFRALGVAYFSFAEYKESEKWFLKLIEALKKSETNIFQLARAYIGLGGCYFHDNRLSESEVCFLKSEDFFKQANDKIGLGYVYNWLGIVYSEQEKVFMALEMDMKALSIAKEVNNNQIIVATQNSIGLQYFNLKDYDKALYYFTEALKEISSINNLTVEADLKNNLGMVYRRLQEFDKSKSFLNEALKIRKENFPHDFKRLGHTLANLGATEYQFYELKEARLHLIESLEVYSKISNYYGFHQKIICQLAMIALKENNPTEALEFVHKYEEIRTETGSESVIDLYHNTLSEYYVYLGDYEKALEEYNLFAELNIAEEKESLKHILENFELRMDYEKQKTEAEIFRIRNEELAKVNETKDKLLSVIAHDLRGPIANIIEVLKLLSFDYNSIPEDELDIIIGELLSDTQSVYELLQNLLSWARKQMNTL
ncbi:MAG: tetratricopeptide repeat protein, partial [Candidatus Cloacimonetes bacterium]|nr:tetratricopeptide repeat protein [Candidatus Cloacimonadota bacterium]